ncbi:PPC domain-containing protein [bacterium]|nr:PPC domain-containing protein [bacterium]
MTSPFASLRMFLGTMFVMVSATHAAPRLSYVYPIGFERGKTITLNIVGQNLDGDIEIRSTIPGKLTLKPVDMVDGKPAYNIRDRRDAELIIDPQAPVGIYPVRVRTADGVSNQVYFAVGTLPDVAEVEPNSQQAEAQPVPLGVTLSGAVGVGDRDIFRVTLPAGGRLVAEVEAKRIGMPMDSALTILDSQGRELASNDDAVGLDSDSRVDVTVAKGGDYYIAINDVTYQLGSSYRLKIGNYEYAEGIFPLAGPRQMEEKAWAWRHDVSNLTPVVFTAPPSDGWAMIQPMGNASPSMPLRYIVSDRLRIVETPGMPQDLPPGYAVDGVISAPGEKDRYRLATSPGQRFRLNLSAKKSGSLLDAVLAVENKDGQAYTRSVDQNDPIFDFVTPADVQEIFLAVEDLGRRGGPGFVYRLAADSVGEDFSLEVQSDVINIPQGTYEYVPVRVDRRGYNGPIQLFLPEKVHGITAEEGRIEAGQNEGYVLLSAKPGTAPSMIPLEIWGRGGSAAQPIDRQATGSPVNLVTFVDRPLLETMPAALCQASPFSVQVASRAIRVPHGIGSSLGVTIQRSPAVTEPIRIEPKTRIPSFPSGVDTTIAKEASAAAIAFPPNVEYGRSEGTMVFTATTVVDGREVRVTLPPISVALVTPFSVSLPVQAVSLPAAGTTSLPVVVAREQGFDGEVRFRVDNLPKGITVVTPPVPNGQVTSLLEFKGEGIAPGEYTVRLVGLTDFSGRKQTKDYELPPREIKLTVPAS